MSRARDLVRRHPRTADAIPAAVAVALAMVVHNPRDGVAPPLVTHSLVAVACVVAAGVVLLLRRERRQTVWQLTFVLGMASSLLAGGTPQAFAPCLVAIYTLAAHRVPREVFLAVVVTGAVPWLLTLLFTSQPAGEMLYSLLVWVVAAAAVGTAVGGQRAVISSARQRALDAERTADEHAQRQVAEERLHIARELHDIMAHHIAVITVQSGVAKHLLTTDQQAAVQALDHVRDAGNEILREIPALLGVLRDEHRSARLDAIAPVPRLRQIGDLIEATRQAGLTVVYRQSGVPFELDPVTDLTAYRVAQEALTNAVKHGTGQVDLSIDYRSNWVEVTVSNPVCEAPSRPSGYTGGNGVTGMTERMSAIGGTLQAGSADGTWVVRAVLTQAKAELSSAQRPLPLTGGAG